MVSAIFMNMTLFTAISSSCLSSLINVTILPCYRPENVLFRTKATDSDIVIVDFGMCVQSMTN